MSNPEQDLVTALVVGSISIEMGVPLAPARAASGLRLKGSSWEPVGDSTSTLWQRLVGAKKSPQARPASNVITLSQPPAASAAHPEAAPSGSPPSASSVARTVGARSRLMSILSPAGWASVAAVIVLAPLGAYLLTQSPKKQMIPIASAPAAIGKPQAVTVIAAPYEPAGPALPLPPATEPAPPATQASGPAVQPDPVPQVVIAHGQGGAEHRSQPHSPVSAPPKTAPQKAVPDDKAKPSAVLVDEGPSPQQLKVQQANAAPPKPAASAASAAVRAPSPAAPAPSPTAAASKPGTPPALARGTGLVTVTPDGKLAVFSNPKTRMPESFKVGDQLPNGEVVRSIDAKDGKVITNAKEYTLE